MTRVVYVNGRYLPHAEAQVHVEDRGFQFGDSVYEVMEVRGRQLVDASRHFVRLMNSLNELSIAAPLGIQALTHIVAQVVLRNRVVNGIVYIQVSRGVGRRDFPFSAASGRSTLVCYARMISRARIEGAARRGLSVMTCPDTRWARCDIKTVMLLPACLAKTKAQQSGAEEAWFVDRDGFVTEGASSTAWIISHDGTVVTRHLDNHILPGVTRASLLDILTSHGLRFAERAFSVQEALDAREVFLTSASNTVMPIVEIDGVSIGDGRPGATTQQLRAAFQRSGEILPIG